MHLWFVNLLYQPYTTLVYKPLTLAIYIPGPKSITPPPPKKEARFSCPVQDSPVCTDFVLKTVSSLSHAQAFIVCLPNAVGQHIRSTSLHMVEHLRIWMGTVFTQSFDPSVADLVLDLIWSCEPRAFIPIRSAVLSECGEDLWGCDVGWVFGAQRDRFPRRPGRG